MKGMNKMTKTPQWQKVLLKHHNESCTSKPEPGDMVNGKCLQILPNNAERFKLKIWTEYSAEKGEATVQIFEFVILSEDKIIKMLVGSLYEYNATTGYSNRGAILPSDNIQRWLRKLGREMFGGSRFWGLRL